MPDGSELSEFVKFDLFLPIIKADENAETGECDVFGWASIVVDPGTGSPLIDRQKDVILIQDLEDAVYDYVLTYSDSGVMHEGGVKGKLIESVVFTPEKIQKMGLEEGALPQGWWVGFRYKDPDVTKKVRNGELPAFSIQGRGKRSPINVDGNGG